MFDFIKRFLRQSTTSSIKKPAQMVDYSQYDTAEKVQQLIDNKELMPALLFPLILGGEDSERNTVYLPASAVADYNQIVASISRLVEQQLVDKLKVTPNYQADSLVASSIDIQSYKDGQLTQFNPSITIWSAN